jgi:hypothetical protein
MAADTGIGSALYSKLMNYRALCFVDMPFGQKPDLKSGMVVDFDQIYNDAIEHTDVRSASKALCEAFSNNLARFAELAPIPNSPVEMTHPWCAVGARHER